MSFRHTYTNFIIVFRHIVTTLPLGTLFAKASANNSKQNKNNN